MKNSKSRQNDKFYCSLCDFKSFKIASLNRHLDDVHDVSFNSNDADFQADNITSKSPKTAEKRNLSTSKYFGMGHENCKRLRIISCTKCYPSPNMNLEEPSKKASEPEIPVSKPETDEDLESEPEIPISKPEVNFSEPETDEDLKLELEDEDECEISEHPPFIFSK